MARGPFPSQLAQPAPLARWVRSVRVSAASCRLQVAIDSPAEALRDRLFGQHNKRERVREPERHVESSTDGRLPAIFKIARHHSLRAGRDPHDQVDFLLEQLFGDLIDVDSIAPRSQVLRVPDAPLAVTTVNLALGEGHATILDVYDHVQNCTQLVAVKVNLVTQGWGERLR